MYLSTEFGGKKTSASQKLNPGFLIENTMIFPTHQIY